MKEPRLDNLERVLQNEGEYNERWDWKIKGTEIWHHPTEPSIQYKDGDWVWFWMNQPHRLDGPALFIDGEYEYWIHGNHLTKDEWESHP